MSLNIVIDGSIEQPLTMTCPLPRKYSVSDLNAAAGWLEVGSPRSNAVTCVLNYAGALRLDVSVDRNPIEHLMQRPYFR